MNFKLLLIFTPVSLFAAGTVDWTALDKTCKPCEDFYQFSIGAWHQRNPIPANQSRWGKRWSAADSNLEVLQGIAQTDKGLIGTFYNSCMDTRGIDAAGAKPIESWQRRIHAISNTTQLQETMAALAKAGISPPFQFGPMPHPDDPNIFIAGIGPSRWSLPDRDYFLKDDEKSKLTRQKLTTYGITAFKLVGWDADKAAAAMRTVIAMETAFARAQMPRVDYRDPYKVNNLRTLAQVKEMTPSFDWPRYMSNLSVNYNGIVVVRDLAGLREFERQLKETSLNDWKTWLEWRVIRTTAPYLSKGFRDAYYAFEIEHLQGRKEPAPRWKDCVSQVDSLLGDSIGKAYAEKVFPATAKARMQELIANLRLALAESVRSLEWMTAETKEKALAKLATFDPKVGYPDPWRLYNGEPIGNSSYFRNVERAVASQQLDALNQIGKPVDRTRWGMTVPTSNAYYNPARNEIVFPAGILTPPMFDAAAEDAVNYGAIGVVIGHEISHGYDDQGSQYDATGKLKNWWTPIDRKQFMERAQCVVDQFNGYEIEPGVAHNGKLVLGESIGDLAGARIAYLAYMKSLENKPRPANIEGFTPEQRFFISWGQSRGDSTRIEEQRRMVVIDPHPVAKYRVNGPLSNMPEFHKAFACKRGDAMVRPPEKQCRIW